MTTRQSLFGIVATVVVAALFCLAGSSGSARVGGMPLFALCAFIAFGVQWVCFLPAWLAHTERFFDLVGSSTFIVVVVVGLIAGPSTGARSFLLASMVGVWALRLGIFLFTRISRSNDDRRFAVMKHRFGWFLMTWTIQGLWVLLAVGAALRAMTAKEPKSLGWIEAIGLAIWVVGLATEVLADEQKRRFRKRPENRDSFISEGLWSWSQHPNYFGEILLWTGIAIVAIPGLSGWSHFTLVSPLWVWLLLTRISGIPMLERHATKQWGDDSRYRTWRDSTPVLVPRPPTRNKSFN